MIYIEAPDPISYTDETKEILFLAGGITGCPDWQFQAVEYLKNLDIVICNPRRKDFEVFKDAAGFTESKKQIEWEFTHLQTASQILFWFCKETIQPIVLFELGIRLTGRQQLFIGVHPDYPRRFDLITQIPLHSYGITIVDNLNALCQIVINYNKILTSLSNK